MTANLRAVSDPIDYHVQEDETAEKQGLISSASEFAGQAPHSRPRQTSHSHYLILFAASQSIAIIILLVTLAVTVRRKPSDLACATQLSPYSPYLESGELEYEEFTEQNHLMQPSPYRGLPTKEVEEAWIRLWRLPMIGFPEDKMEALNKTAPENYAHVSSERGGGMLGFLNVFHQLHCLNLVRQYTYRNEYDYSNVTAFRAPAELVHGHVDHCIETIRKAIMCTSDVTPVVFIKDPQRPSGSKSDFNLRRKCRNYQRIQDWAMENWV